MGWFERPEFGANVGLIDEIYRQYLDNPESVSPAWRDFFAENEPEGYEHLAATEAAAPPAPQEAPPAEEPAAKVEQRPAPRAEEQPKAKPAPRGDGKVEGDLVPLRGAAARIVEAMEASREVPTATSVRTVPARLLEVNRSVLNGHLRRRQGGKVSFTHMIAYTVVKALEAVPVMTTMYREVDGKPNAVRPEHVNLGLAVDTRRPDGSRTLLVPNIKRADTLDFAAFVRAYEELIAKVKANKLTVQDFADTTLTITNPGTIGTVLSVPRLMAGQSAIIGVGAIDYPAEYQGADPDTLADAGIGKVVTLTSTYDHRVIQGAESGEFLARMHRLLLGEDDFYAELFRSMTVPYVPVLWRKDERPSEDSLESVEKQAHVLQLINMYRVRGHLIANLDPLKAKPPQMHPELDPATYGFTIWDLERRFVTGGLAGRRELPLGEILHILRDAYCRTGTVEYMHNAHTDEKQWIQDHVEGVPQELPKEDQLQILHKLSEAEAFERFLHNKYTGHKRFSLEGGESLIPMLDAVLDAAADDDMEGTVIGMSHRGRLNVLANTVGKSYGEIFGEFEGNLDPTLTQGSGDVKYHLGAVGKHVARSGKEVRVEVASNPSHLEAVNPVVEGLARARQDLLDRGEEAPVLPILIHGDAAFAGQGVVAETLNLSQLRGYRTGGTVHIVVNNQVGFTTSPDYGRSSTYATDVAKMIQAPIFHVNGDDPEACVRVARLAFQFRQAFKKDVVIDMWCYRRYGHNEADEPSFTQPLMYERIKNRRPVRKLYTEALVNRGDITIEDAEQ
ncbi:MAG TPA: multifunctional oxoglutarate decarboxylase/oxoglutarate dehydrogenase thiamine pyrophosphate-binding subunit/dihydrolipoyllysine-residue succinyltransferase subunit, partial [Actinomycetota bacterium]